MKVMVTGIAAEDGGREQQGRKELRRIVVGIVRVQKLLVKESWQVLPSKRLPESNQDNVF